MSESTTDGAMPTMSVERAKTAARAIVEAVAATVLGQREAVDTLAAAYLADGHVLLQGPPGIGKTLLARSFASALGLAFTRVQFTPDLMPADVVGANVFDQATRTFRLVPGPVFTQVLLADEVNRTPPKTQAALLEAMQERQVSIDGTSHPLDPAFLVVATSNPIEFEGTYPLPEAQLDRFLARVDIGLPPAAAEAEMFRRAAAGELVGWSHARLPGAVVSPEEAASLRHASRSLHVAPELLDYLAALVAAVRSSPHLELAVSPRGALSLLELARAFALLEGRDFVIPDDLARGLTPCWAHRLVLTAESELEGVKAADVLSAAAAAVPVPH